MTVKICVPITGKNKEEILKQAEEIMNSPQEKNISVVEFRYDLARELPKEDLLSCLEELKSEIPDKKLLFTIRTRNQGGEFLADYGSYESLNCAAIESGYIDLIDIELRREGYSRGIATQRDLEGAGKIIREAMAQGVRTVASYHDFKKTPSPDGIRDIFLELRESGADILKTAFMPNSYEDVLSLMLATRQFRTEDMEQHEYISMSMGKLGLLSRLSGKWSGSDYSFMTIGEASAPGQIPVEDSLKVFEVLDK